MLQNRNEIYFALDRRMFYHKSGIVFASFLNMDVKIFFKMATGNASHCINKQIKCCKDATTLPERNNNTGSER